MNGGVEALELGAGILRGGAPVDGGCGIVACVHPGGHLALRGRPVAEPAVEALALERARLDLGDVQPAAVLGRVADRQLVGEALGLGGRDGPAGRGGGVGVQPVHDEHDPLGARVVDVDRLLDALGDVEPGAPVQDAPAASPAAAR
jgi:hypothetical protein